MFGLFDRKQPLVKVVDKVWMTQAAKWSACETMVGLNPQMLLVAWFRKTYDILAVRLGQRTGDQLILASQLSTDKIHDRMVVFAEHYPLVSVEQELFSRMSFPEVPVLSALDEPLLGLFNGERTIELMRKLGMDENEVIGHSMITKAIRNAQRKIEEKVKREQRADSPEEWLRLNYA